jgi:hypothetical protein
MIYIDFQAGSHGNFLEFICNKFLAQVPCQDSPFNTNGAAHSKLYTGPTKFMAHHYFESETRLNSFTNNKLISVQITKDDLLPLLSISLLRAGDHNIDNNQLEINTYHKLNNKDYKWMLDNLIDNFFKTQIQDSYNQVRDQSWPSITTHDDFVNLPQWIQYECLTQHRLKFLKLDQQNPNCPRHVLREFFKIGFLHPCQFGFLTQQSKVCYSSDNDVFIFPYSAFYCEEDFLQQLKLIAEWSKFELHEPAKITLTHRDFLLRQPYKDSKKFCDKILIKIYNNQIFDLPQLDLFQESYISANLENHYRVNLSDEQDNWFCNSKQILDQVT